MGDALVERHRVEPMSSVHGPSTMSMHAPTPPAPWPEGVAVGEHRSHAQDQRRQPWYRPGSLARAGSTRFSHSMPRHATQTDVNTAPIPNATGDRDQRVTEAADAGRGADARRRP